MTSLSDVKGPAPAMDGSPFPQAEHRLIAFGGPAVDHGSKRMNPSVRSPMAVRLMPALAVRPLVPDQVMS